jgi:hypothetical protein
VPHHGGALALGPQPNLRINHSMYVRAGSGQPYRSSFFLLILLSFHYSDFKSNHAPMEDACDNTGSRACIEIDQNHPIP